MGVSIWLRRFAWATLVANVALVVTGGAVRLTGSGLGCPTWPRCNGGSFTPHGDDRAAPADRVRQPDPDLRAGRDRRGHLRRGAAERAPRPAPAVGGARPGDPRPGGARRHHGADRPQPLGRLVPPDPVAGDRLGRGALPAPPRPSAGPTGAGHAARRWPGRRTPSPGSCSTPARSSPARDRTPATRSSPRNGLDPLQLSQLHADLVFLLIGLTIGMWFALRAAGARHPTRSPRWPRSRCSRLASASCSTSPACPSRVVMLHMLGAALVVAAATWLLVSVLEPADTDRTWTTVDLHPRGQANRRTR